MRGLGRGLEVAAEWATLAGPTVRVMKGLDGGGGLTPKDKGAARSR
jgi:hypothetical protein